ncbi:hypothetical protein DY000_02036158 [Brassica cretica]|uniref:AT-hook motif nuclear-localized protein n=1 Tax=Brassica cretica TaxID=69181 RepID=A0ABQ7BCT1_BRACR|nr:hypothetical protein DY000_02036158 [Brassica cretica]
MSRGLENGGGGCNATPTASLTASPIDPTLGRGGGYSQRPPKGKSPPFTIIPGVDVPVTVNPSPTPSTGPPTPLGGGYITTPSTSFDSRSFEILFLVVFAYIML